MEDNLNFVEYLNSLHTFNAQNENAYSEKNFQTKFFDKVFVQMGIFSFLQKQLSNPDWEPRVIVLTGQAGDGKTSVLYSLIKELTKRDIDTSKKVEDIVLPSGKYCRCIKDFSEFNDADKKIQLQKALDFPRQGDFAFVVANTGPLLNTFGSLFNDNTEAQKRLVEAMDKKPDEITDIYGYKLSVINIADMDNTYFAEEFLNNIISEDLWRKCNECGKGETCYIIRNINLIRHNFTSVTKFLTKHYIWLKEHNQRLTIRNMSAQLAFMITGGGDCKDIKRGVPEYGNLFPNLFFGYKGLKVIPETDEIIAIRTYKDYKYDKKKLCVDDKLLIENDYKIFGNEMIPIIEKLQDHRIYPGWSAFIHRLLFFINTITDEEQERNLTKEVFSEEFPRYLELLSGDRRPTASDKKLITDALSMIYIGEVSNQSQIPITLSRKTGISQSVQLVIGTIFNDETDIVKISTKDKSFGKNNIIKYDLYFEVDGKKIDEKLSIPLLDYFDDLRKGIIPTNIDPQLSHGIENFKSQLASAMHKSKSNDIKLFIADRQITKQFSIDGAKLRL